MNDDYCSAEESAQLLGVSTATLYAYVSRKRIRSYQVPGSRLHRYWRADIERLRKRDKVPSSTPGELQDESEITLITERGPYYRGISAVELAKTASLEYVAALLWGVDERNVFTPEPPRSGPEFKRFNQLLSKAAGIDKAIALFPFLERANPRAHDLSPTGMARTGADVLRWLSAIILGQGAADGRPIHVQFGQNLKLPKELQDLVRRLLVLSADHGFEQSTFAVRAVASMGVTPWRAVATGLVVTTGRRSKLQNSDAVRRFVAEIISADTPEEPVLRRVQQGEALPGFNSPVFYPERDPRARSVLDYCNDALSEDASYKRLKRALLIANELQGVEPSFALAGSFAAARLGLGTAGTPASLIPPQASFLIGRSAGWIAHAIEQYKAGEAGHRDLVYRGPLPDAS